ncbi:LLM class flavin-dependent oxidoreductase [Streptomyces sp. NPDC004232]|uniref:LLM class flavin-dependent oxidoreductase n=1 Tax=Streptomyces sp. NPDC004232 TaxID=3154454 RepID=UPI0033A2A462
MKLGVFLSHETACDVAQEAERLGYGMALVPEGFRSDAPTVLGAVAAHTRRIALASGVMQVPARTPVMTALTAATLDGLSGGRFRLGLGVSNPDVSLGWYGAPFNEPLSRLREYVAVVRTALQGEPVRHSGRHYRLPPEGTEEAAHLAAAPVRADLPIYLAGVRPGSLRLAAEIADGWVGVFSSPERIARSLTHVREVRGDLDGFEVVPSVPIAVADDLEQAADTLRGYYAKFIGLGAKERGIYFALATDMGFGEDAEEIHARYAAGDRMGAVRAVPFAFMDRTALIGPVSRIAPRIAEYAAVGVTTLGLTVLSRTLEGQLAVVRAAAEATAGMAALADQRAGRSGGE